MDENIEKIPENRKMKLDSLFEALTIVAEEIPVYLCDMRYDYSRWSWELVEDFDMPGEYMYHAGVRCMERIHPDDKDVYGRKLAEIFNGDSITHDIQFRARRKDGLYNVCTCRGMVIIDDEGKAEYFAGLIRNHSKQSHIDDLTGMKNQYAFFEDINDLISMEKKARILVVGIGRLTEINELYGYRFGNQVIQMFGRYIMDKAGKRGGTYRLDGSKFAVIAETLSVEEIKKLYKSFRVHFREGLAVDNTFVVLELNAGLLSLEDFDTDEPTIYACLNFAYDESKVSRHGSLVEFHDALNHDDRQKIAKLHVIRNSITRGYKGFYLLYQPVVDADTEQLIGAEALLRWKNEEYGVVPPDSFIPVLEKDPQFPELGAWILRTAIEGAKRMRELVPDFVINVNLSYAQLEQANFTDMVWDVLKESDYPADHLCLEITERCRLLDMDLLRNVVVNLRAGGVKVALDDFGTGFSSIGLVKNLPFDTIKIDRSFVQKIEDDDKERRLVNNFTEAAGTFGAKVCVEGIETSGMRDILRKYEIQSFQGYYYSKPIELEQLIESIKKDDKFFAHRA